MAGSQGWKTNSRKQGLQGNVETAPGSTPVMKVHGTPRKLGFFDMRFPAAPQGRNPVIPRKPKVGLGSNGNGNRHGWPSRQPANHDPPTTGVFVEREREQREREARHQAHEPREV